MQRIKNDIDAYVAAGKAISGKDADDQRHSNNAVIARLSERLKESQEEAAEFMRNLTNANAQL